MEHGRTGFERLEDARLFESYVAGLSGGSADTWRGYIQRNSGLSSDQGIDLAVSLTTCSRPAPRRG